MASSNTLEYLQRNGHRQFKVDYKNHTILKTPTADGGNIPLFVLEVCSIVKSQQTHCVLQLMRPMIWARYESMLVRIASQVLRISA